MVSFATPRWRETSSTETQHSDVARDRAKAPDDRTYVLHRLLSEHWPRSSSRWLPAWVVREVYAHLRSEHAKPVQSRTWVGTLVTCLHDEAPG
jgi:hypothetical protein